VAGRAGTASVSVVIVTTGGSRLLERSFGALAAGDLRPLEVVLVDQGGSDLPERVAAPLGGAGIELRRLAVEPMGVSRARNLGARAARGEHLAFTDDDCVPGEDWLERLVDAVSRAGAQAASGRVLALDEGVPGLVAVSLRTNPVPAVHRPGDGSLPWDVGTGGNLLIAREVFERLGGFDEELGPGARFRAAEDVELIERMLEAKLVVAYEPDAVVYHEMKPRSRSLRRSFPYGYGMGAVVAGAAPGRRGLLACRYLAMQARAALSALRHGSPGEALECLIACAAMIAGALAARRRGAARAS
jgi:GT2 family glycosyltransferase